MISFEMIKYHGQEYPLDIPLNSEEIVAHFDITHIEGKLNPYHNKGSSFC